MFAAFAMPAAAQQSNVPAQDCSGTITTGGVGQTIIPAGGAAHGWIIGNPSSTEILALSFTSAAVTAAGPWVIGTTTATASTSFFSTPLNIATGAAVVIRAVTAAHAFSCAYW
jgi:hypothetical protein